MMVMKNIENLTIWWTDVRLEKVIDGQLLLSADSFERPVIIIDNQAFLVFKITSRTQHDGYLIQDLEEAGLSRPSYIRTDAFVPVHESDLKYEMGCLSNRDIEGFLQYLEENPPNRTMKYS